MIFNCVGQIQDHLQQDFVNNLDAVILRTNKKQDMWTTNDGNVSRRFFENPDITVDITGVNADLIQRFKSILNAYAIHSSD